MNTIEHLLMCVNEECGEIIQDSSKILRFGFTDINPKTLTDNRTNFIKEINDLISVLELLQEEGVQLHGLFNREDIEAKKKKLRHYMNLSKELGLLKD